MEKLNSADYLFTDKSNGLILITRKSSDLFDSIHSGHFQDELERCINEINEYGKGRLFWIQEGPWAAIEGDIAYYKHANRDWFRQSKRHRDRPIGFPAMQISLQSAGGMFIWTATLYDTALALASLYRRGKDGWPTKFTYSPHRPQLRWSNDKRVQCLMGLIPRLREQQAVRMLERFGSIRKVLEATPEELKEIEGLGPKGIENIQEALDG